MIKFFNKLFFCISISLLFFSNIQLIASENEVYPAIGEAEINSMIEKAKPEIEKVTGRTYKNVIKVNIVKREVVRDILKEELLPQMKKLLKGMNEDLILRQVEMSSTASSQVLLGKYSYLKKELYIIPDNIKSSAEILKVKNEEFNEFVFLVVTHEMVHFLDDQDFNIEEKIKNSEDADKAQAFNSLLEGNAVYVTEKVAENLNISETATKLSTKSAAGITDETNRLQSQIYYNIYVKGCDFVKAIIGKKGIIAVAAAFQSPPSSTRQIMYPEEYLNPSPVKTYDCAILAEKVREKLDVKGMQSQSITINSMTVQAILVASGVSENEANIYAEACIKGAMFIAFEQGLTPRQISVIILQFKDKKTISDFIELEKKVNKSQENQFNAKLNSSYTIVKDEKFDLDNYDYTNYRHVEKKTDQATTADIETTGTADTLYVNLSYLNTPEVISKEKITEIYRHVYSALQEMMK